MSDVTEILSSIEAGDKRASEQLLPLVYEELRRLAATRMAAEPPDHTLQATALVHEAYLRLVDVQKAQHWNSRGHFFGAAAEAMRRILVEHARYHHREKRGGNAKRVDLEHVGAAVPATPDDVLAVNEALEKLRDEDPATAKLVMLRYFAGLSIDEAAELLGISRATAYRQWTYAKAWFKCELRPGGDESAF